jgi:hypothetical protein
MVLGCEWIWEGGHQQSQPPPPITTGCSLGMGGMGDGGVQLGSWQSVLLEEVRWGRWVC